MPRASKPKSFIEAVDRHGCLYISGDLKKNTAEFCGEKRVKDTSRYCAEHHALCNIPPTARQKKELDDLNF